MSQFFGTLNCNRCAQHVRCRWSTRRTSKVDSMFQRRDRHHFCYRLQFVQHGFAGRSQSKSITRISRLVQKHLEQPVCIPLCVNRIILLTVSTSHSHRLPQMVKDDFGDFVSQQTRLVGREGATRQITDRRLLSRIRTLHHTTGRYVTPALHAPADCDTVGIVLVLETTRNLTIFPVRFAAIIEPGEDPEVVRAKYFIRDEFLVGYVVLRRTQPDLHLFFLLAIFRRTMFFASFPSFVDSTSTRMINVTSVSFLFYSSFVFSHHFHPCSSKYNCSASAQLRETANTTVIHTSRVPWTRKTFGEFSTTAAISFNECI